MADEMNTVLYGRGVITGVLNGTVFSNNRFKKELLGNGFKKELDLRVFVHVRRELSQLILLETYIL